MDTFLYSVWFRDLLGDSDDQDYEWVACFRIRATTETAAKAWGDFLAQKRACRIPSEVVLHSSVEADCAEELRPAFDNYNSLRLPIVHDGEEATDDQIGW
jgi:hypothetical protein